MQRHIRRTLLVIAVLSVFVIPVAVSAASDGFTDVDDTNVFKADIDWLAAAEVTKGCNPPANTLFCPKDTVTRETMAAFMHRLAINKVVDAKTAETAKNADKLDGLDSSAFLSAANQPTVTGDSYFTATSGRNLDGVGTIEEVSVSAPESGFFFVSATASVRAGSTSNTLIWLQVNDTTCSNATEKVTAGGYAYAVGNGAISGSFSQIIAVPQGNHTLTLCGNPFVGDFDQVIISAGVQSLWVADGELTANLASVAPGSIPGTEG